MRISKGLLVLALCLLLAGCSLARPEAGAVEDRFAGFYVVREESFQGRSDFWSSANPLLTEYGTHVVKLDKYGTFDFPDLVLFAQKEGEQWVFPGLEDGFSLYILHREEDYGSVTEIVSNMAPGEEGPHITSADGGGSETASGVVYYGPPLGAVDWNAYDAQEMWHVYRVYQAPDGAPYLDGSGNSFTGGGLGAYTETHTRTVTEDGETAEETLKLTVSSEAVPRLEKLVVTQFDGGNSVLCSDELALRENLPEVRCVSGAAWVLVEEVSAEGTKRTLYNVPEDAEPVSHMVVLLDEEGLGQLAYLNIRRG